jgi:two-component system, LytTR family, response regulator
MIGKSPETLRVLVVDDEAPARQRLVDVLKQDVQVTSLIEASDGLQAVIRIEQERPDLVFLDVQMPELDGMGVIQTIGPSHMPLTVFVTAYDQHAIDAFESNALDYLLKPFSDERLEATLARAKTRLAERQLQAFGQHVTRMFSERAESERYLDRLVLKSNGVTHLVRVADIDWIEGAGVYVNLHVAGRPILYRASLNELAENLNPQLFVRVHRSSIVNIDSILRMEQISHGEFDVVLKHGGQTRVSRTYRVLLERRLGQSL